MLNLKKLLTKVLDRISVKTGTFTKSQSGSTASFEVKRMGSICVLNGYISGVTTTANSETQIGTISGVPLPTTAVRTICSVGNASYSIGTPSYMYIGTDGGVLVTSSNGGSGKAIFVNATWGGSV